jgi:hypothetical protein
MMIHGRPEMSHPRQDACVRFQNKANADLHCDQALYDATADIVTFNLRSIVGGNSFETNRSSISLPGS